MPAWSLSVHNAPYSLPDVIAYSHFLNTSFYHWLGRPLITVADENLAEKLYHAPFVVVSHNANAEPMFVYANLAAQHLWQYDWESFTSLPSRLSAEPQAQEERQRLLEIAEQHGYVDNYSGIRISKTGRRFEIRDTILWNVLDGLGNKIGQAATFNHIQWI